MVLRVQEVLLLNSCARAVTFEQLKVKGIDGRAVSSQVPDSKHDAEDESEGMEEDLDADDLFDGEAQAAPAPAEEAAGDDGVDSDGTEGFEIYEPQEA